MRRFLVLSLFVAAAAAAPLGAQSSWDRYQPRTLTSVSEFVLSELREAVDTSVVGHLLAESDFPTRARVTYAGSWRRVSPGSRGVIESFAAATGLDAQVTRLFAEEALLVEEGRELWIPVQSAAAERMRAELRPGTDVTVFAMWVGAEQQGRTLRSVFIVNEFITATFIRDIDLGPFGKVVLGEELRQRDRILGERDGSLHFLRPGTFGGAERIAVELTDRHLVKALHFTYEPGTNFEIYLANNIQLVGQPLRRTKTDTADGFVELVFWQDEHTIEELEQRVTGGESRVYLRLIDRKLSGR